MYALIKSILFLSDPEQVHYWVMRQLKKWFRTAAGTAFARKFFFVHDPGLSKTLWGLRFDNPVGLAAGFDKDAKYIDELALLGFGFIEIGTVTPLPQDGNAKPRLFRLPKDRALINRMGFNNEGVRAAAERLRKRKTKIIIGGNIGKNKITPNDKALDDYETCFRELYDYVDYFTVNVSSPNTPNLRELQDRKPLMQLLTRLQIVNTQLGKEKPILLKIAPDLTREQLDDIIEIVFTTRIHGIVATNTTISRSGLRTPTAEVDAMGAGGLSGLPVKDKSTEVIRYLHQRSAGKIPMIAAGGIFNAADAKEKLDAGAVLVQVYTGFIYEGPAIVKKICKGL